MLITRGRLKHRLERLEREAADRAWQDGLRERLADLCHRQWSGWMEYLFSKGTFNDDGTWTMPAWAVKRWTAQMVATYEDLSPEEQNSDRKEADRFLALLGGEK